MGKMLKNEVAKNELKEVRHSEEWHKSGEKVKYRLADAMKSCMKKAPVEKITVKEITEECGVTRQTFYRNFQDKYDLINWYFDKILIEIIYVFLTIFLYLLKCPQSLILSALRAFCLCGKPHISRLIFLYFPCQSWLKSW